MAKEHIETLEKCQCYHPALSFENVSPIITRALSVADVNLDALAADAKETVAELKSLMPTGIPPLAVMIIRPSSTPPAVEAAEHVFAMTVFDVADTGDSVLPHHWVFKYNLDMTIETQYADDDFANWFPKKFPSLPELICFCFNLGFVPLSKSALIDLTKLQQLKDKKAPVKEQKSEEIYKSIPLISRSGVTIISTWFHRYLDYLKQQFGSPAEIKEGENDEKFTPMSKRRKLTFTPDLRERRSKRRLNENQIPLLFNCWRAIYSHIQELEGVLGLEEFALEKVLWRLERQLLQRYNAANPKKEEEYNMIRESDAPDANVGKYRTKSDKRPFIVYREPDAEAYSRYRGKADEEVEYSTAQIITGLAGLQNRTAKSVEEHLQQAEVFAGATFNELGTCMPPEGVRKLVIQYAFWPSTAFPAHKKLLKAIINCNKNGVEFFLPQINALSLDHLFEAMEGYFYKNERGSPNDFLSIFVLLLNSNKVLASVFKNAYVTLFRYHSQFGRDDNLKEDAVGPLSAALLATPITADTCKQHLDTLCRERPLVSTVSAGLKR